MSYNFSVVGIGSSAGGLVPLKEIISQLPYHLNAAIVLVPHLSTTIPSRLDHILSGITIMPVIKVTASMRISPGKIYVMGEGLMMTIRDGYLRVRPRSPHEKINKAIDIFFTSLAPEVQDKSIAIILSGAGFDGIEGAKKIESYQGIVIVQDPETAQFPLMPSALIANDHPDYVLTPDDIVTKIIEQVDGRRRRSDMSA